MQQVQLLPTLSEWCQLIGGLAKQRQKGTCSKQLPWQLWQELQHTGLQLDEIAYSTGGLDTAGYCTYDMTCT